MSNSLKNDPSPTSPSFLSKSPSMLRKDQLSSWKSSPTFKEKSDFKNSTDVHFSLNVCFLSACANGDLEDAEALLLKGADINAKNIDGITALHQACLDDNEEVLEFLLRNKANVNAQDSEGWTPLHAAAYCGYANHVERLIERGADAALINSSGELPIDLAEEESVSAVLRHSIQENDIDVEEARDRERRRMLDDICELRKQTRAGLKAADFAPISEATTQASPLHVAAAKGYTDVISLLLECSTGLLEAKDVDGWTPLHAAAHWGHKEAVRLLCEAGANLDATNAAMQTPSDLADPDMMSYLRQLKEKFGVKLRRNAARNILDNAERRSTISNRRSSVNRLSMDQKMMIRMNKEKSPVASGLMEKRLVDCIVTTPSAEPADKEESLVPSNSSSPPPKSPKSPKSPRSPVSPLSLPKIEDICEEGQSPDISIAHCALASHCLGACVLPLTCVGDADAPSTSEAKEEEKDEKKTRAADLRGSLRSCASIESEEPSIIVHEDEVEGITEVSSASKDQPPIIVVADEEEVVRRKRESEEPQEYAPMRRAKINSLIAKPNEKDWRSHRNAISEYDEESETVQRISLLMAPERAEISESQRIISSRQALSDRRSTQGEVDPKFSLKPIPEHDAISRLETLEARVVALESSNAELRQQMAELLKAQEEQRTTSDRFLVENEAVRDQITALEQENAVLKQQNADNSTKTYTMEELKEENSKLRDENSSLVRVISRLSKSRDHEDDTCHKYCERCEEHFGAYIASMTRL